MSAASARRSSLSGSESYFGLIIGALNSWNASFSILNRIYVRFTAMKCDPDKNSFIKNNRNASHNTSEVNHSFTRCHIFGR